MNFDMKFEMRQPGRLGNAVHCTEHHCTVCVSHNVSPRVTAIMFDAEVQNNVYV